MSTVCKLCFKTTKSYQLILPCCGFTMCYEHYQSSSIKCPICKFNLTQDQISNLLSSKNEKSLNKISTKNQESKALLEKIKQIIARPTDYVTKIALNGIISKQEALEWTLKELEIIDLNDAELKINCLYQDTLNLKKTSIDKYEFEIFLERRLKIYDCIISYLDLEKRLNSLTSLINYKWNNLKETKKFSLSMNIHSIEYFASRKILILCTESSSIKLFNTISFQLFGELEGHLDTVTCIQYINDNSVASGSKDKTIMIWDLDSSKCINTLLGHNGEITCLIKLKVQIIVSGSEDKTIRFWKTKTGECLKVINAHSNRIISLDRYYDNFDLISSSKDGTIKLWKKDENYEKCHLTIDTLSSKIIAIRGLNDSFIVCAFHNGLINIYEKSTGQIINVYGCNEFIKCIEISVLDSCVIVGLNDGSMQIINVYSGQCVRKFKAHTSSLNCLFKCSNLKLFSISKNSIKLWNDLYNKSIL